MVPHDEEHAFAGEGDTLVSPSAPSALPNSSEEDSAMQPAVNRDTAVGRRSQITFV